MRGGERGSEGLFAYLRLEDRIAKDHPLRAIRALVNEALAVDGYRPGRVGACSAAELAGC